MFSFKSFINKKDLGTLTMFDVDETLFNTKAKIRVVHTPTGKVTHTLDNQQFNTHQLEKDHHFDFSEFRSAEVFKNSSDPIKPIVDKLKANQKKVMRSKLDRTIIVTARADFDSKAEVVKFFQKHGIDVDNEIYIERSGNLNTGSTAGNKLKVFDDYLSTGVYKKVRLYDDAVGNLKALLSLQPKYPEVKFEAWLVDGHTGSLRRYKQ